MKYVVSVKTLDALGRNEWHSVLNTNSFKKAVNRAKKESKTHLEADVIGTEDEEVIHHSFYEGGNLSIDMSL